MLVFPKTVWMVLSAMASTPGSDLEIVHRPLPAAEARASAMLEYRRQHEDPKAADIAIIPRVIVIHHTAIETLAASFAAFERPLLGAGRPGLAKAGRVNVSAHFLIGRDGTVYQLLETTQMARHTIGLNHTAIGVENVGGTARTPLTKAQLIANAKLVRWLRERHPTITHLIGHDEYQLLEGHDYWRERDPGYRTKKQDPGPRFMAQLRALVVDLDLAKP